MLKSVHDYLEDTTQSVMKLLIQACSRFNLPKDKNNLPNA